MAYNLGAVWLQVIPSFEGIHDAGREAGRQMARDLEKGYNQEEDAATQRRTQRAKERGKSVGAAEAKARRAAKKQVQDKSDSEEVASEKEHQKDLTEIQAEADLERLREKEKQGKKLTGEERRLQSALTKIVARGQQDRLTAAAKADAQEESRQKASNRRRLADARKLQRELTQVANADSKGFAKRLRKQVDLAREQLGKDIELNVNTTKAEEEIFEIQRELKELTDGTVDVEANSAGAISKLIRVTQMVEDLDGREAEVDVDVDTAAALGQLASFRASLMGAQRASRGTAAAVGGVSDASLGAANSFRAFNGVLFAATTIGPILVPSLLSIAGALGAVATSSIGAFAALGTGALAFSGIGDALGAMGDLQSERLYGQPQAPSVQRAQRDNSGAVRSAGRGVADARRVAEERLTAAIRRSEDAKRSVADAERNLARTRVDANERIADAIEAHQEAQESLAEAQEASQRAQEGLTAARREARREIEDLNNSVTSGALAERDALYDLEEARYRMFRIQQDGSATEREKARARLSYKIQAQQFKELQLQNDRLQAKQEEVSAQGVEGSDAVSDARQRIADADEAVIDAQDRVADAARARQRAEVDAARAVEDAVLRLADTRRNAAEAAEEISRTREENARNIERAQEALADAMVAQEGAALGAAGGVGALATQQSKLQEALDNLSPAAQEFARWLFSLKPLLDELRFTAQEGFLPGLQAGMETVLDVYAPKLLDFVERFSEAMGGHAEAFGEWLIQPEVIDFFDMMADYAIIFMDQFAEIAPNLAEGFMGIMEAMLPFTEAFGDAMIELSQAFSDWANSEAGQQALADFFGYLERISPQLWTLFSEVIEVIVKALIGLVPYIDTLIDFALQFFGWLSEQSPETLGQWAENLIKFVAGFQALAGLLLLFGSTAGLIASIKSVFGVIRSIGAFFGIGKAGAEVAAGTGARAAIATGGRAAIGVIARFGLIGLAIAAVLTGLYLLYEHVEPFRNFVNAIVDWITVAWTDYILPVFRAIWGWIKENLVPIFVWLWQQIKYAWDVISVAFDIGWTIIEVIFKLWLALMKTVGRVFSWVFEEVIAPVWNWLYDNVIYPVWQKIKPIFEAFGNFITDHVVPAFERGVELIGDAWEWLKGFFAEPIIFVVDTIINDGLLGGAVNPVLEFFDIEPVDPVSVPRSIRNAAENYATGGVLPGYSPGQDVHSFFSPTAGRLNLSGGEAILRPEVTAVLGEGTVNALNDAAISGGRQGVAKAMGGGQEHSHFLGGVIDWIGDAGSAAWNWISDIASYAWDFATDPVSALTEIADSLLGESDFPAGSKVWDMVSGIPASLIDMIGSGIKDLLAPETDSGGGSFFGSLPSVVPGGWARPSFGPITSGFGPRWGGYHAGVDIAGGGPTYAAAAGRVLDTGWNILPGRTGIGILLGHGGGVYTYYGHNPPGGVVVSPGEVVDAGERIGAQGATGNVTGTHLHFEVGSGSPGNAIPPLEFLRRQGVSLYDDGGWLPDDMLALNRSGKPEAVFTHEETQVFKEIAEGGGAGTYIDIDVDQPGATAGDIADELMFAMRRMNRGGAYVRG